MKHHPFSPRVAAAAAVAGMAVLLAGGTATGAMAAVTAASAQSASPSTSTAPGAPTGLTAIPGNGLATLSWSAPSSDGGSPVDFYVIEGGTSPSNDILDKVGGHTATLAGLTNGTAYSFSVHAQNAFGDGPAVTVQVTPQPSGSGTGSGTAPGAPTGLKTSDGDGFIALSWSPPASAGGSLVTGYHVYMGFSSSFTAAREFTSAGPSFRLTDAENGSTYFIKVTAVNAAGEGPATPVTSVIPGPHVVPGPPRPTGLTARAPHGEVILSWSPPPGGLTSGDGYLIYMGTSPGHEGAKPSFPHLIEGVTSFMIAPLTDGTRYYFQVALLDGNNQVSARSAEVSAVPGAGTGSATGPSASASAPGGGGVTAQPTPSPLPSKDVSPHGASSSSPAGLIIGLAALALAATGGATAIVVIQRRRKGRGYAQVPTPRRPYDDEPASPFGRTEEKSGPRYR